MADTHEDLRPETAIEAAALALKEATANKGAANGYAPLDAGSKVPVANLPAATGAAAGTLAPADYTKLTHVPADTQAALDAKEDKVEALGTQSGATYQPVLADVFKTYVPLSHSSAITVTLPLEATVGFRAATGSRPINFVWVGDGQPTFVVPGGGTLTPASTPKISAKDKAVSAIPVPGGNEWRLIGSLSA